jgi:hypothetical protein
VGEKLCRSLRKKKSFASSEKSKHNCKATGTKTTYFQVEVKSVTKNVWLVTEYCTVEHENFSVKKNVHNIVKFFQELEIMKGFKCQQATVLHTGCPWLLKKLCSKVDEHK